VRARAAIAPLDQRGVNQYVRHRLRRVGYVRPVDIQVPELFPPARPRPRRHLLPFPPRHWRCPGRRSPSPSRIRRPSPRRKPSSFEPPSPSPSRSESRSPSPSPSRYRRPHASPTLRRERTPSSSTGGWPTRRTRRPRLRRPLRECHRPRAIPTGPFACGRRRARHPPDRPAPALA
jgi:hypothetical protein